TLSHTIPNCYSIPTRRSSDLKSAGKLGVDVIDLLLLHQAMPGEFDQTSMPTAHWNDSLKRGRFAPSGSVTLWLNIFEHCAIGPTLSRRSTRSKCTHFSRNKQCVNYIMHGISPRRPGRPSVASPTTWVPEPRLSKTRPLALSQRNISAHQPRWQRSMRWTPANEADPTQTRLLSRRSAKRFQKPSGCCLLLQLCWCLVVRQTKGVAAWVCS